jgi:2-oxoglutarate dehydrogenase E1 component
VASYEKWEIPNSLVMLLPHGFEGQGPEHSSARLERFLILCAQNNMQVCNVTTPAQYYHLLRRQIKNDMRKPLVIMTPKSLLRHPEAKSYKNEFLSGRFNEVLDDNSVKDDNAIERLLFTSGKVYYDLAKSKSVNKVVNTAIVRIEQFYPYERQIIQDVLKKYSQVKKVIWVQEEPKNMGAWNFISSRLIEDLLPHQKLLYSGRPESASPAVGSARISEEQQINLVREAFEL